MGYDWHAIKTKLVGLWAIANGCKLWATRMQFSIF